MYTWMKANQKKMMAIFGVVLMIAFILPAGIGQTAGGYDAVVGHVGDDEVTMRQLESAGRQWELLVDLARQQEPTGNVQPAFHFMYRAGIVDEYRDDAVPFLLLQREAERMNVGYSPDSLNTLLTVLPGTPRDMQQAELRRQALANLLLVNSAFDRATSAVKISAPRVQQTVAENLQTVRLNLVDFDAATFLEGVPAPTPEQVTQQIEKFGNVDPDAVDLKTNPHGFSYRLPNRVKLQYLQIPADAIRQKVEKSKDEFTWRSQAAGYYQKNLSQFPTTRPTQPEPESMLKEGGDAFQLGGGNNPPKPAGAPNTQPTTRPFEEVYSDIRRRLMQPEIDQEVRRIQDRVSSLLIKGYERHQAKAAGKDAPQPASSITADYGTHEFLQQVAQVVQRETGVLPSVVTLDEQWRGPEEIDRLPGIGNASLPDARQQMMIGISMGPTLSEVLFSRAEAFMTTDEQKRDPEALSVLEPTPAFRDPAGNVYVARMTAAVGAHAPKPEERSEVAARAEHDLRMLAAYEKALDAARKLREQAETDKLLQSAANAANHRLISTGPISQLPNQFSDEPQVNVEGYTVDPRSERTFADGAFALLRDASPDRQHPTRVIELPRSFRVVVGELNRVDPVPSVRDTTALAASLAQQRTVMGLTRDWFSPENVKKRMNWRAEQ